MKPDDVVLLISMIAYPATEREAWRGLLDGLDFRRVSKRNGL